MPRIELKRKKIANLECLVAHQGDDLPTVILFHGYGADMNDLAPLAQAMSGAPKVNWVFPNGHISLNMGGYGEGRAWFPIPISELEGAFANNQPLNFTQLTPPGMKRARENAAALLRELKVPSNKLVIGGFSQGAMLATDVVLNSDQAPAGLVIMSGTLINAPVWTQLATKHSGLKFFMSHGDFDQILPVEAAQQLEKLLVTAGWKGKLMRFNGPHGIPPEVLIQVGQFLRSSLV